MKNFGILLFFVSIWDIFFQNIAIISSGQPTFFLLAFETFQPTKSVKTFTKNA